MTTPVIYQVECTVDPSVLADFDAWLPGHVRDVTACAGFTGAEIQVPDVDPGSPPVRLTQYRLESREALERYFALDAARLRADGLTRFGDKVTYARRILVPRDQPPAIAPAAVSCLDCGATVHGSYCAACGQKVGTQMLTVGDITHDVVHSALHLDSRVWRTLRSLALKPGELTNAFIAGKRQTYLPPFRLYLVISIAFFALSALLPDANLLTVDEGGERVLAREIASAAGGQTGTSEAPASCAIESGWPWLDTLLAEACGRLAADGGRRLGEVFLATAPKLMFLFLPLMAAVAMLFYWRPRRLYAEHLVLFLHTHAFLFIYLTFMSLLEQPGRLGLPVGPLTGLVAFALTAYLAYYVFRAMRVVYGEGRLRTAVKFGAIGGAYFVLLGLTMLAGIVYSMLSL